MYVKQEEIRPIVAKEHMLNNWDKYDLTDTKEDFVALLNILQACGENLENLHDTFLNGKDEFCDIYHNDCWNNDREIAETLFEFCSFFTESEFIDLILERKEDYENDEEYVQDMFREATDNIDGNNDVQISKTDDGYVRRIWC